MKITCKLTRTPRGAWSAVHDSRDVGRVEATAPSREQVLEKLRGEIRYRLELCPCTGESYRHIDLEVLPS